MEDTMEDKVIDIMFENVHLEFADSCTWMLSIAINSPSIVFTWKKKHILDSRHNAEFSLLINNFRYKTYLRFTIILDKFHQEFSGLHNR